MRSEQVIQVAVVSLDPAMRLEAARAFDSAPPSWDVSLHQRVPDDADVIVATPDVEYSDAIRFNPEDPCAVIDAVAARLRKQGRIVVVSSPAGGTGATTVALHLAALAAATCRGCYIDLDTEWGAADRLALPRDAITWLDATDGGEALERSALPMAPGLRVLLAPRSRDIGACESVITAAAEQFDRVVVDAPRGDALTDILRTAHCGVLVMSPAIPSARRAKEMLEAYPDVRWAVVSNRLGPGGEVTRAGLQRILGCRISVELPCCPAIRDREDEGRLLKAPMTRWVRRLAALYRALEKA